MTEKYTKSCNGISYFYLYIARLFLKRGGERNIPYGECPILGTYIHTFYGPLLGLGNGVTQVLEMSSIRFKLLVFCLHN